MAKLQLYITKTLNGLSSVLNINPSEEVSRHVADYRPALSTLEYDLSESHLLYLVSYCDEGLLLSAIRTIASREKGTYIAATLFVPTVAEISSAEVLDTVAEVGGMLSPEGNDPSGDEVWQLRQALSTEYGENDLAGRHPSSSGQHYAFAYLGGGAPTLEDYAGVRFYQPGFPHYAGVLLFERSEDCRGADPEYNITPKRLIRTAILLPPKKTRQGFAPYLQRKKFTQPAVIPIDTDIEIEWHKPGFDAIRQTVRADRADSELRITPPDTTETQKLVSPSSFHVTMQGSQESVGDVSIKVNDVEIDKAVPFAYADLISARVEISAPGYATFSGTMDLASTSVSQVQLKAQRRTYRFDLPLDTPDPSEPIHIYLKTRKPISACPIEGYAVAGGVITEGMSTCNNLYYVGGQKDFFRRYRHIWFGILGLLAGIVIGCLVSGLRGNKDSAEVKETPTETPVEVKKEEAPTAAPAEAPVAEVEKDSKAEEAEPAVAPTATVTDYKAAVAYLDGNKKWTRAGMAETPGLEGLFDDLNTYNFERLKDYWAPLLSSSRNFTAVIEAVKGSKSKRNPRTGAHNPNYNAEGDDSINWLSYTYWIDP